MKKSLTTASLLTSAGLIATVGHLSIDTQEPLDPGQAQAAINDLQNENQTPVTQDLIKALRHTLASGSTKRNDSLIAAAKDWLKESVSPVTASAQEEGSDDPEEPIQELDQDDESKPAEEVFDGIEEDLEEQNDQEEPQEETNKVTEDPQEENDPNVNEPELTEREQELIDSARLQDFDLHSSSWDIVNPVEEFMKKEEMNNPLVTLGDDNEGRIDYQIEQTTQILDNKEYVKPTYVINPDLYVNERRVVQEAAPGQVEVVIANHYLDGQLLNSIKEITQVLKRPIGQIIEIGSKERPLTPLEPATPVEKPSTPLIPLEPVTPSDKPSTSLTPLEPATPTDKPSTPLTPLEPATPIEKPSIPLTPLEPTTPITPEVQVTHQNRTEIVELPFKIIEEEDPTLLEGEKVIELEGQIGFKEQLIKDTYENGTLVNSEVISEEIKQNPINQIVRIGTLVETLETETSTQAIDFDIERRENPDLDLGLEQVVQEGQTGETTITYEVTYHNGQEVDRQEIKREITTDPVNQIIEIGTRVVEVKTETQIVEIPQPEDVIVEDPTLERGESDTKQAGRPGQKTITYEVTYHNGQEIQRETFDEKITRQARPSIIHIGTKVTETIQETKEKDLPFEIEVKEDNTLPLGETKVQQVGQVGTLVITEEVTLINGEETNRRVISEEVTKDPIKEIIHQGTKVEEEEPSTNLPFDINAGFFDTCYDHLVVGDTTTFLVNGEEVQGTIQHIYPTDQYAHAQDIPFEDLHQMSREERNQLPALMNRHFIITFEDDKGESYRYTYVKPLSQDYLAAVNTGYIYDMEFAQNYMLELVNEARRKEGLHDYTYNHDLQEGVTQRSREQAEYGHIRHYQDDGTYLTHSRDVEGTSFKEAYIYLDNYDDFIFGENSAAMGVGIYASPRSIFKEKYHVERLFQLWMNSPGHRRAILSPTYTDFALGLQVSDGVFDPSRMKKIPGSYSMMANMVFAVDKDTFFESFF